MRNIATHLIIIVDNTIPNSLQSGKREINSIRYLYSVLFSNTVVLQILGTQALAIVSHIEKRVSICQRPLNFYCKIEWK